MNEIVGTWLICDAIYSLRTYWNREDWFAQGIRWARLICGTIIIILS